MQYRKSGQLCLIVALLTASPALAGGLYIREFGQPSQGTAGAGDGVLTMDASTAFLNPSGLFNLESDSEWMVTGISVISRVEFDPDTNNTIPGNDGGNAGGVLPGLAVFHKRRLSENWGLAFSLNSIAGAALDYTDAFVGRYTGTETELLTVTFKPSLAYRIREDFSVSLGVQVLYGELDFEAAIPPLLGPPTVNRDGQAEVNDGDELSAAVAASVLWQVTDRLRVGLRYLGENEINFDSNLKVTLPAAGGGTTLDNVATDVEFTFPQTATLSVASEIGDHLTVVAAAGWEDWSAFDSVPISTNALGVELPLDWDDVWSAKLGLMWGAGNRWTYFAGVAYDSDPSRPGARLSILPVDEQWRVSAGVTREFSEHRTIGGVVTFVDLGDARTSVTTGVGTYSGEFDTNRIVFLGLNFNRR